MPTAGSAHYYALRREEESRRIASAPGDSPMDWSPGTENAASGPREKSVTKIDLSLKNGSLYAGCDIEEVAGKANLKTPVAEAVQIVGRNVQALVACFTTEDWRGEITLTGPMAVWAYLVVFHAVVHCFNKVYYDDGRTGPVLVAAHG